MHQAVWTIKDIIAWSIPFLKEKGSSSARLDAELMLCKVLGCRRIDLFLDNTKPLDLLEKKLFRECIRRRAAGEPVAYILGYREFYGLSFEVNAATLIPRPETEHLVERVLASFSKDRACRGLDVGTGTGCIAVSIKQHQPGWEIEAWDASELALVVAARNIKKHGQPVKLIYANALLAENWQRNSIKFDFVVSNPPYISPSEKTNLPNSVVNFEPYMALFAENSGLEFYQMFASYSGSCLVEDGKIFLEIGSQQAFDVCSLLEAKHWQGVTVHKDLAGLDRIVEAVRPKIAAKLIS